MGRMSKKWLGMILTLFCLLLGSCGTSWRPEAFSVGGLHRILNGTASSQSGIGLLTNSPTLTSGLTGWEFANRCVVTAGHGGVATGWNYYQSANPKPGDTFVPVLRSLALGTTRAPNGYQDLALVWMGGAGCSGNPVVCNTTVSWQHFEINKSNPSGTLSIFGFGDNSLNGTGFGTLRTGSMNYQATQTNPTQGGGAYIIMFPVVGNNQCPLEGDSGSPLVADINKSYGVASSIALDVGCTLARYTAFQNGNDTWFLNNTNRTSPTAFCQPKVGVTVGLMGNGTVTGVANGAQVINCGITCSVTPQIYDITLTATPATGWTFVKWTDPGAGNAGTCDECNGSTSTTCTISVNDHVNSKSNIYSEMAMCTANFAMNTPTPTPTPSQSPSPSPTRTP